MNLINEKRKVFFHTSLSNHDQKKDQQENDVDIDLSKEWIPPSTSTLSSSSTDEDNHSQKGSTNKNNNDLIPEEGLRSVIEEIMNNSIGNEEQAGSESVTFLDFDALSESDLQSLMTAQETNHNSAIATSAQNESEYILQEENVNMDMDGMKVNNVDEEFLQELAQDEDFLRLLEDEDDDGDEELNQLRQQLKEFQQRQEEDMGGPGSPIFEEEDLSIISKLKSDKSTTKDRSKVNKGEESSLTGLDEFLRQQNLSHESDSKRDDDDQEEEDIPDWLQTRREKLNQESTSTFVPTHMLTPNQATEAKQTLDAQLIPIRKHTLLSSQEITSCLHQMGALDITVIKPSTIDERQHLGYQGLVIATGTSYSHIRLLTDRIVSALKLRKLGDVGVNGAKFGAEGGDDEPFVSAYRKKKTGKNLNNKKIDDGWMVVDCKNYVVHVQDEATRRSIDLEGLWSPDPVRGKAGRQLRNLDLTDDDAVDEYLAVNPIPEEYVKSLVNTSSNEQVDYWGSGSNRSNKVSARWTPIGSEPKKERNRGKKKNRRF